MKKLLLTGVLVLSLAIGAAAQKPFTPGLTGKGIKAGLSVANFTGADASGFSSKTGFAFGGFLEFSLSPSLALQPELYYVMKGASVSPLSIKLSYLEVPVLLKMTIPTAGQISPNFYVGPFFSVMLSADASANGQSASVSDFFNSTDVGLTVGAGIGFPVTRGKITIDGRYDLGLTKPWKSVDTQIGPVVPDIKNGAILLLVGYSF